MKILNFDENGNALEPTTFSVPFAESEERRGESANLEGHLDQQDRWSQRGLHEIIDGLPTEGGTVMLSNQGWSYGFTKPCAAEHVDRAFYRLVANCSFAVENKAAGRIGFGWLIAPPVRFPSSDWMSAEALFNLYGGSGLLEVSLFSKPGLDGWQLVPKKELDSRFGGFNSEPVCFEPKYLAQEPGDFLPDSQSGTVPLVHADRAWGFSCVAEGKTLTPEYLAYLPDYTVVVQDKLLDQFHFTWFLESPVKNGTPEWSQVEARYRLYGGKNLSSASFPDVSSRYQRATREQVRRRSLQAARECRKRELEWF